MFKIKKSMWIIFAIAVIAGIWFYLIKFSGNQNNKMIYGVSFNTEYASYLGLDPRQSFLKILDDWKFKYVRLSAQWDLIEKMRNQYDWSDLDWMMDSAAKRNAKVILVVGNKTPRWPECHYPAWVDVSSHANHQPDMLNFIKTTVERYKNNPALEIWQVENEPFLSFGDCGPVSKQELKEEVGLVKQLDPLHPTMVTDSGELSLWFRSARSADLFGATLYRVVWDRTFGYWTYDWILSPLAYTARLWLNNRGTNSAYITELQAEPWIPNTPFADTPMEEQLKSMNLARLKSNVEFAARTGMPRAYLWGAEWWLWLEGKGANDIPDYIKQLKKF